MTANEKDAFELKFPDSIISRIAKSAINNNSRLSKDACKIINRCATLFSIYVASLSAYADSRKKSTVQDIDVKNVLEFIYPNEPTRINKMIFK